VFAIGFEKGSSKGSEGRKLFDTILLKNALIEEKKI
jgi:hypothetical protein